MKWGACARHEMILKRASESVDPMVSTRGGDDRTRLPGRRAGDEYAGMSPDREGHLGARREVGARDAPDLAPLRRTLSSRVSLVR